MTKSQAFAKSSRLLNASDYSYVFQNTKFRVSNKHFLILASTNESQGLRLGLIIAKKHVKLAVQRNRLKRLIRESFRTMTPNINNLDIVVLARPNCAELSNDDCTSAFDQLWRRLAKKSKAS